MINKAHPLRDLFKELIDEGWNVYQTNKKIKMEHDTYGLVTCSTTPSCPFVEKHVRADVKRKIRGHYEKTIR